MPRYEFSEGTSNKFWEIELAGTKYTAKWGKIGGSTSMSTKDCGSPAAAQKAYDKLIAEKTGKGYQLVGGKPNGKAPAKGKAAKPAKQAAPAGPARNAELEKAIAANPDDKDPYLVYADWLQGQGEIRGELIVLQAAGKTKEANALIRKFSDWFLGPFGGKKKPPAFTAEWQFGYIKSAHVGWANFVYDMDDDGEGEGDEDGPGEDQDAWAEHCKTQLIAFLQHPSAKFIQELVLGPVPGEEEMSLSPLVEAIALSPGFWRPPVLTQNSRSSGSSSVLPRRTLPPRSVSLRRPLSTLLSGIDVDVLEISQSP
jgi:uncharacterized protein (TIGR02996 family)